MLILYASGCTSVPFTSSYLDLRGPVLEEPSEQSTARNDVTL